MRSALSLAILALPSAMLASLAAFEASASARVALASIDSIEERRPAMSDRIDSMSPLVAQPPSASRPSIAAAEPAARIFLISFLHGSQGLTVPGGGGRLARPSAPFFRLTRTARRRRR